MSHYKPYPAYKDSGVEWLGKVPAHWNVSPLKYLVKAVSGGQATKNTVSSEAIDGLYPAFSASGQDVWMTDFEFDTSGIVLSAVGARCGKTFKADGKWGVVANTHCIFPKNEADRDYFWYLTNREDWWEKGGTAQPFVKVGETLDRKHCFPPKEEQVHIGKTLDRETARIDALISKKTRFIELLREKRQALITHAVTKGLDPRVKMKDSRVEWLGEVPEHWEIKRLQFLCASIKAGPFGSALTKDMYVADGYRVYGQEQVIPGDFSIGDYYITPEYFSELVQYAVQPGDVLVSCVGTFGKIAVVPEGVEPGIINPRLIRIRVNQLVSPVYLTMLMRSSVVFEQFSLWSRGGTMDVINIGTLSGIVLALPPASEQQAIHRYVSHEAERIDALVNKTERSIELLKERRSALITAAVTGQIDLREAA